MATVPHTYPHRVICIAVTACTLSYVGAVLGNVCPVASTNYAAFTSCSPYVVWHNQVPAGVPVHRRVWWVHDDALHDLHLRATHILLFIADDMHTTRRACL